MFPQKETGLDPPSHRITVLLIAAVLMISTSATLRDALVYDRDAILSGQLWRILTGHLVHFSRGHLISDLAGFVGAVWMIKMRRYPSCGTMYIVTASVTGLLCLQFLPDMIRYGGLSAIGISAITYLCLCSLKEDRPPKWIFWSILVLTAIKIFAEIVTGRGVFISAQDTAIVPVPLVHIAGAAVASLYFIIIKGEIPGCVK